MGSSRLVERATYSKEKSRVARAATSAALPSSGTSVFLRLVLRRALRHERVLLGDEDAASELAPHVDVAADLEEIWHGARVDDRHARCPVDVAQGEAQAVAARVSVDRPHDAAGEAHVPGMVGELARSQRRRRAAREARVEQEDGEDRRDGERDDE